MKQRSECYTYSNIASIYIENYYVRPITTLNSHMQGLHEMINYSMNIDDMRTVFWLRLFSLHSYL